ncbi:MAG: PorT family protein [Bacteroides sp.]|nr:PorT family protein [Bacteroides sp.]
MAIKDKAAIRKLLFFALFAIATLVTSAQNQVNWSLKAGVGMGNLIGDNMISPQIKLAYKFGFALDCPLSKVWALQTGLFFVSKGTNHTIVEVDGYSAQAQVNALYMELPLMAAVHFTIDRNTKIIVSAGPYSAWGVGGKTKALGYSWSSSSKPDWNSRNVIEMNTFGEDGLDLRRFDYGVGAGIAVEYRHYIIGIDGQLGLSKLQTDLDAKHLTGFVTVGYKF